MLNMPISLIIAWRNLYRHKGKSFVIGLILCFGAFIMTVGNGVINGLDKGLRENIVENFSGDIVLVSDQQIEKTVLVSMSGQTLKPIPNAKSWLPKIEKHPAVSRTLAGGVGYVWVHNENGNPLDQYMLGVDIDDYLNFFDQNLIVEEGKMLQTHERGVLVSTKMREWYHDFADIWTVPFQTPYDIKIAPENIQKTQDTTLFKSSMVYMGLSNKNASLDILTDVVGIVRFKELNSILGFYCLVDMASFRECMGYFSTNESGLDLSDQNKNLLSDDFDELENMFALDDIATEGSMSLEQELSSIKSSGPLTIHEEDGTYNIIFVKLDPGHDLKQTVDSLNNYLSSQNIPLQAITWSTAIGMFGQIAMLMKGALFLFVLFIFIVAVIIIMNTLSMAMLERTSEIGMMRAIGAKKRFVQAMCMFESSVLALVFGGIGIGLGAATVMALRALNLTTDHEMLQIFYGGDTFAPILDGASIGICVSQLFIIAVLSSLYPIIVARKISPLDAVVKE